MGTKPLGRTHSQELGLRRKHRPPGPATVAAMTGHFTANAIQRQVIYSLLRSRLWEMHFLCGVSSLCLDSGLQMVLTDF